MTTGSQPLTPSDSTTNPLKRPFSAEEESSKKKARTGNENNRNQFTVISSGGTDLNPATSSLEVVAATAVQARQDSNSLQTKDVKIASIGGKNAKLDEIPVQLGQDAPLPMPLSSPNPSHLSQAQSFVWDHKAPLTLFNQSMDYDYRVPSKDKIGNEMSRLIQTDKSDDPHYYRAQFHLGCCYIATENYSAAKLCLATLKECRSDWRSAQMALATCFFFEGDFFESIRYCNLVMSTPDMADPSCGSTRYKEGCCFAKLGNLPEAIKYFSGVPATHPMFCAAQFNLGSCYYNQAERDFSNAIKCFEKVDASQPIFFAAQYYLGLCRISQKDTQKAIDHLSLINESSKYFSAAQDKLVQLKG